MQILKPRSITHRTITRAIDLVLHNTLHNYYIELIELIIAPYRTHSISLFIYKFFCLP